MPNRMLYIMRSYDNYWIPIGSTNNLFKAVRGRLCLCSFCKNLVGPLDSCNANGHRAGWLQRPRANAPSTRSRRVLHTHRRPLGPSPKVGYINVAPVMLQILSHQSAMTMIGPVFAA